MNIENMSVKTFRPPVTVNAQQSIEQDFILPDYFGNISKILKCSLLPDYDNISVSGDKISISGNCRFHLVYCGDDNRIYNYSNDIGFSKIIPCNGTDVSDCASVSIRTVSENCRALGPKRVEVRGMLQLSVVTNGLNNLNVISDVPENNIEMKKSLNNVFLPTGFVRRDFILDDSQILNDVSGVCDILHYQSRFSVNEMKVIDNKVYLNGEVLVSIALLDESCDVIKKDYSLKVSEVIDVFDAKEGDDCILFDTDTALRVSLKDSSAEEKSLIFNAKVNVILLTGRQQDLPVIADIYSTSKVIDTQFSEKEFISSIMRQVKTITINYETDIFDDIGKICHSYIDNLYVMAQQNEGCNHLLISANCNALIKNNDESFTFVTRTCNNDYDISDGTDDCDIVLHDCQVISVMTQHTDNKIRFTFDVCISFSKLRKSNEMFLTDISGSETEIYEKEKGIILYYALKDENLWEIGKENKASLSFIKSINNIDEDVLSEDRILVFPHI